ncbi:DUF5071 domain-containing protein [Undibacterium sp. Ren11W]|uniref:DUF5071 domain-containing protein n=1 Tax=Undibacterium sp. Ren11W TaxID=3413045 RepID=UPI003BF44FAA
MSLNLINHLPVDKHDTARAEALVALGYPAISPVLPDLLECIQDGNWPVARVILPFLKNVGAPLASHVRTIFQGNDDTWKYFVLYFLVGECKELATELVVDLKRLVNCPTAREVGEELDIGAKEILDKFSLNTVT